MSMSKLFFDYWHAKGFFACEVDVSTYVNFLDVVHHPSFKKMTFQRLDLSPPSGEQNKGRGPTLLGPLEKASLFFFVQ
jgi:hypothetical protein